MAIISGRGRGLAPGDFPHGSPWYRGTISLPLLSRLSSGRRPWPDSSGPRPAGVIRLALPAYHEVRALSVCRYTFESFSLAISQSMSIDDASKILVRFLPVLPPVPAPEK